MSDPGKAYLPMPLDEDLRTIYEANPNITYAFLVLHCQTIRELRALRAQLAATPAPAIAPTTTLPTTEAKA